MVVRNDFTGPAGILGAYVVEYEVDESNLIIGAEVLSRPEGLDDYIEAFGEWLKDAYPDVHSASYQGDGAVPFRTVADAEAAIELVDEFLAQSDEYPLEQ